MIALDNYRLDPCREDLGSTLHAALVALAPAGKKLTWSARDLGLLLERPPDAKLGDYALPCFRFAKEIGRKPQEIAAALADALSPKSKAAGGWVSRCDVANAFLNIFVDQTRIARSTVPAILSGEHFRWLAQNRVMPSSRVMIEYSQPNTHKEFHVGHARNVCLGNALVRLFDYCGYDVTSANYYGDEGTHIAIVLWYIQSQKLKAPEKGRGEWLGKMYVAARAAVEKAQGDEKSRIDAEISAVHRDIERKQGATYELWLETRAWSLDEFRTIYHWLDVDFKVDFFESEMTEAAQTIVDELLEKGVLVRDDGAVGADLKAHKLGFCILRKRDGNTLYATKDLVLARRKFEEFQIDRSVYVVGNEQNHHFKQVFKVLELMGFKQAAQCFHLSYGMVVLPEGKMSSRDGTSVSFVELRQMMLQELGKILAKYDDEWPEEEISETARRLCDGALKYGMIATDPKGEIVFDMNDWLSFEGDSGPYLMYSYTRTRSILRKAQEQGFVPNLDTVALLADPVERELLRYLHDFNEVVAIACEQYKPSLLTTHLFHMCKAFNRFYAEAPVLKAEADLRGARIALVDAFATTLQKGLSLVGITPPQRM